ncbi:MAG: hypothetical protein IT561_28500 [Alphaproteobacteria bacterium]|nr:hypothetical protein [Alphaproteobacteria bacterium]
MILGCVTGLEREARIAARAGLIVACEGPGPAAARRAAERLVARGADLLVSFGYAGGLDPALPAGTLIVADRIVDRDGHVTPCRTPAALADATVATIVGVDTPVLDVPAKAALRRLGGAVDQESHAVARVALRHGRGVAVVRAVIDAADAIVPAVAIVGVDAAGRSRPGRICAGLLGAPWELPALVRLAFAAVRADRALAAAAVRLA